MEGEEKGLPERNKGVQSGFGAGTDEKEGKNKEASVQDFDDNVTGIGGLVGSSGCKSTWTEDLQSNAGDQSESVESSGSKNMLNKTRCIGDGSKAGEGTHHDKENEEEDDEMEGGVEGNQQNERVETLRSSLRTMMEGEEKGLPERNKVVQSGFGAGTDEKEGKNKEAFGGSSDLGLKRSNKESTKTKFDDQTGDGSELVGSSGCKSTCSGDGSKSGKGINQDIENEEDDDEMEGGVEGSQGQGEGNQQNERVEMGASELLGGLECIEEEVTPKSSFNDFTDDIILRILMLLPTVYAVQMSVLSSRFRYIWSKIPCLEFDYTRFTFFPRHRFAEFVNVLVVHGMSLQTLRLANFSTHKAFHLNLWLSAAMKKNVQELLLDIPDNNVNLPECLFTCQSLTSLYLKLKFSVLTLPTSVSFCKLKSLHLETIMFPEIDSFSERLSFCKVLEKLVLVRCLWGYGNVMDMSIPTVKSLSISSCTPSCYVLKIVMPNLVTLKYSGNNKEYKMENLFLLSEAQLDMPIDHSYSITKFDKSFEKAKELLAGVSYARSVELKDTILELLSNAPALLKNLPVIHSLNKLTLTSDGRRKHFFVIGYLLQSYPRLEYLVIHIERSSFVGKFCMEEKKASEISEHLRLGYPHDYLKEVKIRGFQGTGNELEFLKLLLGNANTMERVTIIDGEGDSAERMRTKVLTFQKAANCIISFVST